MPADVSDGLTREHKCAVGWWAALHSPIRPGETYHYLSLVSDFSLLLALNMSRLSMPGSNPGMEVTPMESRSLKQQGTRLLRISVVLLPPEIGAIEALQSCESTWLCGFCCEVTPDEADPNQVGLGQLKLLIYSHFIQLQHVATRCMPIVVLQSYRIPVSNSGFGHVGQQ